MAREILRAFGVAPTRPTLIGTDNLANFKVATGIGCPSRSRHFLRRYFVLKRRIAAGDVTMVHVPDEQMPADCLTKWLPSTKLGRSIAYMTGSCVAATANTSIVIEMSAIESAIAHASEKGEGAIEGASASAAENKENSQPGNRFDAPNAVGGSVVSRGSVTSVTTTSSAECHERERSVLTELPYTSGAVEASRA